MFRIPTPLEVLEQQKVGRRCVTLFTEKKRLEKFVLGDRDPLSFTMHDLIHADHFYHSSCFQGQLGFYGLLDFCLKQNHFEKHLQIDEFAHELDYLISDMNAYAVHLMKCLKAALDHYHELKDFFPTWLGHFNLSGPTRQALLDLNTNSYLPELQDELILRWLDEWRV